MNRSVVTLHSQRDTSRSMRGKGGVRGRRGERRRGGRGEEQSGEDRWKKRSMKEEGYAGHAMVLTCAKYGTTRASSSRVH